MLIWQQTPTMVHYSCFLVTILIIITFPYEICKVCSIHYDVTVITYPFHLSHLSSHCKRSRSLILFIYHFSFLSSKINDDDRSIAKIVIIDIVRVPEVPHTLSNE
jgi:hypothetical protein